MPRYVFDPVRGELIDPETGEVVEDKIPYEYVFGKPSIHLIGEKRETRLHYYYPSQPTEKFSLGTLRGTRLAKILSICERRLRKRLAELNDIARELGAPENARRFALKALSKLSAQTGARMKGDARQRFYLTLLALAYMVHGYQFPYREVYKKYRVRIKPRDIMDLMRTLKVKACRKTTQKQALEIIASIKPELTVYAAKILDYLSRNHPRITSVTPRTLAASLLYILGKPVDPYLTQRNISKRLGITDVVLRRVVRNMLSVVEIEVYIE